MGQNALPLSYLHHRVLDHVQLRTREVEVERRRRRWGSQVPKARCQRFLREHVLVGVPLQVRHGQWRDGSGCDFVSYGVTGINLKGMGNPLLVLQNWLQVVVPILRKYLHFGNTQCMDSHWVVSTTRSKCQTDNIKPKTNMQLIVLKTNRAFND